MKWHIGEGKEEMEMKGQRQRGSGDEGMKACRGSGDEGTKGKGKWR